MLNTIMSIAQETFSDEELKVSSRLEEAVGFDSMALVQFVMELETAFDIEIEDDKIIRTLTCKEVEDILKTETQSVS